MKQIILNIVYVLLISSASTFGQDLKNIQEPEYIGIFYNVDLNSGKLVTLNKENWVVRSKSKTKLFGYGGVESETESVLDGEKSPIRFASDARLTFIVRAESNLIDPSTIIGFSLVEVKSGKRVLMSMKVKSSLLGGGKLTDTRGKGIPIDVQKYGKSSYLFTPIQPLVPGEYALTNPQTPYVFSFGVDAAVNRPNTDLTPFVGIYKNQDRKSDFLELKSDGTLFLQQDGKSYAGKYDIKDSIMTFIVTGITSKAEILGDIIIDPGKSKWIKQKF